MQKQAYLTYLCVVSLKHFLNTHIPGMYFSKSNVKGLQSVLLPANCHFTGPYRKGAGTTPNHLPPPPPTTTISLSKTFFPRKIWKHKTFGTLFIEQDIGGKQWITFSEFVTLAVNWATTVTNSFEFFTFCF